MTSNKRVHIATPKGEVIVNLDDIRSDGWVEFPDCGLRQYFYWINPETGSSVAILEFEKGGGIPNRHTHASNQFMYCLEGRYEYTTNNVVLTPGSFYMNPKDSPHGPTIAHEKCRLIEIYDGPHYYEKPEYHTDDTMMVPAAG